MRTMAMFFMVVYHCLTHCVGYDYGFNIDHPASLFNYILSDVLLVFSSIFVYLYVMVSGYFLADIRFKIGRIVRTIAFMDLSLKPWNILTLGKSLFPLATDAYWFVTQYIGLLILSPFGRI